MKRYFLITLCLVLSAFIYVSCTKDLHLPIPENKVNVVSTTITGRAVDSEQKPVKNARVTCHGQTTATDSLGYFRFSNITVPQDRVYLKVTKSGFFPGCKAGIPVKGGVSSFKVTMLDNTPVQTISSATGGTVSLSNGATVKLPANGYGLGDDMLYAGDVHVAVKHLDPSAANFNSIIPGDLEAVRADGSAASLYSYGMLNVELTGDNGEQLQLSQGAKATLTFPVPASMIAQAPATIPLWYFDEAQGIWKEEGSATLTGDKYVGEVKHFTSWNCDYPQIRATIEGRVVDCNGKGVQGVVVYTGQRMTLTDENGHYKNYVAAGTNFTCTVADDSHLGVTSSEIEAGPYASGQSASVADLVVTCPAYLSGQVTGCGSLTGIKASVIATWSGGATTVVTNTDGTYSIPVPANTTVRLNFYDFTNSNASTKDASSGALGSNTDIGKAEVCDHIAITNSFTVTGGVYNNKTVTLNPTGNNSMDQGVYNSSADYTIINVIDPQLNEGIYIRVNGKSTGNFTTIGSQNAALYLNIDNINSDSAAANFNINVTRYDEVGGLIQGTFQGTFKPYNSTITYTVTNGSFSVIRKEDQ